MLASGLVENLSITHLNLAHNKARFIIIDVPNQQCLVYNVTAVVSVGGAFATVTTVVVVVVCVGEGGGWHTSTRCMRTCGRPSPTQLWCAAV